MKASTIRSWPKVNAQTTAIHYKGHNAPWDAHEQPGTGVVYEFIRPIGGGKLWRIGTDVPMGPEEGWTPCDPESL